MQKIFVLMAAAIKALLPFKSSNQFIVTGKITDDKGPPLSGVSARAKGTVTVARSDFYGAYFISVADEKAVLQFAYIS